MTLTIQETITTLHSALLGYIEATYHVADPKVVTQRRGLLEQPGGIFQSPYLESTPRYETGEKYAQMKDVPAAALAAYQRLSDPTLGKPLLFDPPYSHQAQAIRTILHDQRNVMIMTGTGSGKTESFLLPILGKLAVEARDKSKQFEKYSAIRAMVLYPMNALVNDQLGRLRLLFGDKRVRLMFQEWSGRTAKFARYTSRTPYAGVRSKAKDQRRLKSIGEFFVELEIAAHRHDIGKPVVPVEDARAAKIVDTLNERGKWPAKESIGGWFGSGEWKDKAGNFRRAVTLDDDAELLTRDEVQRAAPDLLITNYSMLEYMMLRPIERTIFDQTKAWLAECPDEKFLIVLDEAHLYRGAQGAEVGLLLRRLRERLDIPIERFQVICATASFSEKGKANAGVFGSELTGAPADSFEPVVGAHKFRPGASVGTKEDLDVLAAFELDQFFAEDPAEQAQAAAEFLTFRGIAPTANAGADLVNALKEYGPFSLLVNETMLAARSFVELRNLLFPNNDEAMADRAVNSLIAMGSRARVKPDDASLLPCRVHAFYRGLPGLWACMDPECSQLDTKLRGGPIGKLYSQPQERCGCGAPVLPYFTCRYCGTSYARAYTRDVFKPDYLFAEPGQRLFTSQGMVDEFQALDVMLEEPADDTKALQAIYDLRTGQLGKKKSVEGTRSIYLSPSTQQLGSGGTAQTEGDDEEDEEDDATASAGPGLFIPCGCCGNKVRGGKSSVQDHLTKGDQPFEALVSAQIRVQPPSPKEATEFAPLRGRKVLVFSDSRQVAARLAPALQGFSLSDTLRALMPTGFKLLAGVLGPSLTLDQAWIAAVVAAHRFGIRLRPELNDAEAMPRFDKLPPGAVPTLTDLIPMLTKKPPSNLLGALHEVVRHNLLGLEPLAIASVIESPSATAQIEQLAPISGLAETPEDKVALARLWLRAWVKKSGVWFSHMPPEWWGTGGKVRANKGEFKKALSHVLTTSTQRTAFKKYWLDSLLQLTTENTAAGRRLDATKLSLQIGGDWRRCGTCTSVHRPLKTLSVCVECGSPNIAEFNPDADPVFNARKGFYRNPVVEALNSDHPNLMSLIAAEHTAQLGAARPEEAFSQAERHEMEFQDIDLAWKETDQYAATSIDVLSSTTTMEVGIDIGELSGVALRNMPPGRANYQQRAGRAGRRGNAVATVLAFGSADSHDEHYFSDPQAMIRGPVVDPRLTLENPDIAQRHVRAYLLQRYHEDRLPELDPESESVSNLFSVLGTVQEFRDGTGDLNRADFEAWLKQKEDALRKAIDSWLPKQLSPTDRSKLLAAFVPDVLGAFDRAIFGKEESIASADAMSEDKAVTEESVAEAVDPLESDPEPDNEVLADGSTDKLLDRLLYWGVLPRYAFPTDVATFTVFSAKSTGYRPIAEFQPSQGLNVALSQYAPNKQVWIKSKQYTSKAVYSSFKGEVRSAWQHRRLYYECKSCGHAKTAAYEADKRGEILNCEACLAPSQFGPARSWFRPPGFAHPWGEPAHSVPDEPNETAYATRAKLIMPTGADKYGVEITERVRGLPVHDHLLVSNSGPDSEGYTFCTACGRIESVSSPDMDLRLSHRVPYPTDGDPLCSGQFTTKGVVLGTDFPTDIALFTLKLDPAFRLPPALSQTQTAMRTLCEALAAAACRLLQIEGSEILAEYRPALSDDGTGTLVDVFLYDTLAGGAGFAPQMVSRGKELFEAALSILEHCPGGCDVSCYRCMRTFRNKLDHGLLDRFVGAQLLRHVLYGGVPAFSQERAARSLGLLANELENTFGEVWDVERAYLKDGSSAAPLIVRRKADGKEALIDVHSPIAPQARVFGTKSPTAEIVDELRIRRHLPEAVEQVARAMDGS